jgi:hypothetical protein
MQMSIGMTDLASMEPCDPKLRPFRKINNTRPEIELLEDRIEDYFKIAEGDDPEEEDEEGITNAVGSNKQDENIFPDSLSKNEWDLYKSTFIFNFKVLWKKLKRTFKLTKRFLFVLHNTKVSTLRR